MHTWYGYDCYVKGFVQPLSTSHPKENISIRHLMEKSWKRVQKAMFTFWQLVKKWTTLFMKNEFFEWRWNVMRWHQNWCSKKSVGKRFFDLVHFLRVGALIFRNFFKHCWIFSLRKTWLKKNVFWEMCSSWLAKVTTQFANAKRRSMNNFTVQRNMRNTHATLITQKRSKWHYGCAKQSTNIEQWKKYVERNTQKSAIMLQCGSKYKYFGENQCEVGKVCRKEEKQFCPVRPY